MYTLYPEFQISLDESKDLSQYKLRLQAAREAIETGRARSEQKHFVSLPTEAARWSPSGSCS